MFSLSFNKKLLSGFILSMLLLVILSAASYQTISSLQRADDWVSHTLQVIVNTQHISSQLNDAQHKEELYLLTNDDNLLKDLNATRSAIGQNLAGLRWLVRDNPPQVQKIDSLDKYVTYEFNDSNNLIAKAGSALSRSNGLSALSRLNIDKMFISGIVSAETKLLVSRKKIKDDQANSAKRIIIIYTIISLLILAGLLNYIMRTFKARQRLKEQLQLSESKFSKVFSDSGIGMAIVSLRGEWLDVNPYLLEMLGYGRDELLQKTFQEITHPDDLNTDLAYLKQVLNGEIDHYKMEKRYFHKNGNLVWALLTVSLIYNDDATPRFFVVQIEDIRTMKQLIGELEMKNKSLLTTSAELKSKVAQLEEFNRIVAHNLRGPAGSISTMLDMYLAETEEKERKDLLQLINGSSKILITTLNDLMAVLEISLSQSIPFEDCNLNDVIRKTQAMLQGEIIKTGAIINTDFQVTSVRFPAIYFESLFYNMISNAVKYKKDDTPVQINISAAQENGRVKLVFEDNGLGIDLERHGQNMFKLNKVFHQGFDSRGVGLFITKNQLETHGGSISVDSMVGVGTRFTVYI